MLRVEDIVYELLETVAESTILVKLTSVAISMSYSEAELIELQLNDGNNETPVCVFEGRFNVGTPARGKETKTLKALCSIVPDASPSTVMVCDPGVAVLLTVSVKTELLPGVTGFTEKEELNPVGKAGLKPIVIGSLNERIDDVVKVTSGAFAGLGLTHT